MTFWRRHGQPSVRLDPLDGGFPGSKHAEIVDRPIGPDDLHAPDGPHPHGQQDRRGTSGRFILWRHRQNEQIRPLKLRTAQLVPRRLAPVAGRVCPNPELEGIG